MRLTEGMWLFSLYFSPIFPLFFLLLLLLLLLLLVLLHFSTARLKLGHDWEWCRVEKYQKRGLERKTGPKQCHFGLFFKKGIGSKTTFWPVPFKIKKCQNNVVLDPQSKKKIRAQPQPSTTRRTKEEKGGVGGRTWPEASQATASHLSGTIMLPQA